MNLLSLLLIIFLIFKTFRLMAKIHPNPSMSGTSSCDSSSERETFTIWMKSLVFHGNGCTVFNSRGDVVFRVDNYQQRCSSKVFLMDSSGKVLNYEFLDVGKVLNGLVIQRLTRRGHGFKVTLKCDENTGSCYRIIGLEGKFTLKIVDFSGQILAEAMQKQSSEGVPLGEDVLTLMVEPQADQSLIMALVTVYGLINNKL
ncbi:hypothetical protein Pfo_025421 [Paulownia fortunei]|nr:hypothetical protein Pfo_025421 [Paulownia fortunei]